MGSMTYTEQARVELLAMAGTDTHGIWLLDNLLDCAANDTAPDLANLRAHCAEPSTPIDDRCLDFLLINLPCYVNEWLWAGDEGDAQSWFKEILAGLFRLRTGLFECRTCLSLGYRLDMLNSRELGSVDCAEHRELTAHDLFNRPLALVRGLAS